MKYFSFLILVALLCVFFAQSEGASRIRRQEEEDTLDQIQKSLAETFDSFKKAAEDVASKMDLKQLQQDFTAKMDQLSKTISEYTVPTETKAPEEAP